MSAFADRAALRCGGERWTVTYLADKQGALLWINSCTAQASLSRSPLAKPWYAQSKNAKWPFLSIMSAIWPHCSCVGSMPVGLCAHAWMRKTECGVALFSVSMKGLKARLIVCGS